MIIIAFPLKTMEDMRINISKPFYVGLYGADFQHTKNGLKPYWVSWINPETTKEFFL